VFSVGRTIREPIERIPTAEQLGKLMLRHA
jgi:hypothetical protein